jgi:hypothetical protein
LKHKKWLRNGGERLWGLKSSLKAKTDLGCIIRIRQGLKCRKEVARTCLKLYNLLEVSRIIWWPSGGWGWQICKFSANILNSTCAPLMLSSIITHFKTLKTGIIHYKMFRRVWEDEWKMLAHKLVKKKSNQYHTPIYYPLSLFKPLSSFKHKKHNISQAEC